MSELMNKAQAMADDTIQKWISVIKNFELTDA